MKAAASSEARADVPPGASDGTQRLGFPPSGFRWAPALRPVLCGSEWGRAT